MSASSNGKAVILMDGGYVENVSDVAEHHHGPEMDIEALSSKLVDEFDVDHVRTKFYHSYPYQDQDPSEDQQQYYAQRKSFYDAIDRKDKHEFVPRGEVKKHPERCRDCGHTWSNFSQKGVDVGIAVDLVHMAYQGGLDSIILVAGDGDLVHAIEAAKDAYVNVFVAYCEDRSSQISYAEDIVTEADRTIELTPEYLSDCLK